MALLASGAGAGTEAGPLSPRAACGAYDVHVLTLQEDAAAAGSGGEALVASAMTLIEARALCRAGDVEAALAVYRAAEDRLPRIQTWLR